MSWFWSLLLLHTVRALTAASFTRDGRMHWACDDNSQVDGQFLFEGLLDSNTLVRGCAAQLAKVTSIGLTDETVSQCLPPNVRAAKDLRTTILPTLTNDQEQRPYVVASVSADYFGIVSHDGSLCTPIPLREEDLRFIPEGFGAGLVTVGDVNGDGCWDIAITSHAKMVVSPFWEMPPGFSDVHGVSPSGALVVVMLSCRDKKYGPPFQYSVQLPGTYSMPWCEIGGVCDLRRFNANVTWFAAVAGADTHSGEPFDHDKDGVPDLLVVVQSEANGIVTTDIGVLYFGQDLRGYPSRFVMKADDLHANPNTAVQFLRGMPLLQAEVTVCNVEIAGVWPVVVMSAVGVTPFAFGFSESVGIGDAVLVTMRGVDDVSGRVDCARVASINGVPALLVGGVGQYTRFLLQAATVPPPVKMRVAAERIRPIDLQWAQYLTLPIIQNTWVDMGPVASALVMGGYLGPTFAFEEFVMLPIRNVGESLKSWMSLVSPAFHRDPVPGLGPTPDWGMEVDVAYTKVDIQVKPGGDFMMSPAAFFPLGEGGFLTMVDTPSESRDLETPSFYLNNELGLYSAVPRVSPLNLSAGWDEIEVRLATVSGKSGFDMSGGARPLKLTWYGHRNMACEYLGGAAPAGHIPYRTVIAGAPEAHDGELWVFHLTVSKVVPRGGDRAAWTPTAKPAIKVPSPISHAKLFGASACHLGPLSNLEWDDFTGKYVWPGGMLVEDRDVHIAVGAPMTNGGKGAVYLFRVTPGTSGNQAPNFLKTLSIEEFEVSHQGQSHTWPLAGDHFGASLACGPRTDLDGDGFPDLLVGSPGADGNRGRVYALYLQRQFVKAQVTTKVKLKDEFKVLSPSVAALGFAFNDYEFGRSIDYVGDSDRDGHPELVIGTSALTSNRTTTSRIRLLFVEVTATSFPVKMWNARVDTTAYDTRPCIKIADLYQFEADGCVLPSFVAFEEITCWTRCSTAPIEKFGGVPFILPLPRTIGHSSWVFDVPSAQATSRPLFMPESLHNFEKSSGRRLVAYRRETFNVTTAAGESVVWEDSCANFTSGRLVALPPARSIDEYEVTAEWVAKGGAMLLLRSVDSLFVSLPPREREFPPTPLPGTTRYESSATVEARDHVVLVCYIPSPGGYCAVFKLCIRVQPHVTLTLVTTPSLATPSPSSSITAASSPTPHTLTPSFATPIPSLPVGSTPTPSLATPSLTFVTPSLSAGEFTRSVSAGTSLSLTPSTSTSTSHPLSTPTSVPLSPTAATPSPSATAISATPPPPRVSPLPLLSLTHSRSPSRTYVPTGGTHTPTPLPKPPKPPPRPRPHRPLPPLLAKAQSRASSSLAHTSTVGTAALMAGAPSVAVTGAMISSLVDCVIDSQEALLRAKDAEEGGDDGDGDGIDDGGHGGQGDPSQRSADALSVLAGPPNDLFGEESGASNGMSSSNHSRGRCALHQAEGSDSLAALQQLHPQHSRTITVTDTVSGSLSSPVPITMSPVGCFSDPRTSLTGDRFALHARALGLLSKRVLHGVLRLSCVPHCVFALIDLLCVLGVCLCAASAARSFVLPTALKQLHRSSARVQKAVLIAHNELLFPRAEIQICLVLVPLVMGCLMLVVTTAILELSAEVPGMVSRTLLWLMVSVGSLCLLLINAIVGAVVFSFLRAGWLCRVWEMGSTTLSIDAAGEGNEVGKDDSFVRHEDEDAGASRRLFTPAFGYGPAGFVTDLQLSKRGASYITAHFDDMPVQLTAEEKRERDDTAVALAVAKLVEGGGGAKPSGGLGADDERSAVEAREEAHAALKSTYTLTTASIPSGGTQCGVDHDCVSRSVLGPVLVVGAPEGLPPELASLFVSAPPRTSSSVIDAAPEDRRGETAKFYGVAPHGYCGQRHPGSDMGVCRTFVPPPRLFGQEERGDNPRGCKSWWAQWTALHAAALGFASLNPVNLFVMALSVGYHRGFWDLDALPALLLPFRPWLMHMQPSSWMFRSVHLTLLALINQVIGCLILPCRLQWVMVATLSLVFVVVVLTRAEFIRIGEWMSVLLISSANLLLAVGVVGALYLDVALSRLPLTLMVVTVLLDLGLVLKVWVTLARYFWMVGLRGSMWFYARRVARLRRKMVGLVSSSDVPRGMRFKGNESTAGRPVATAKATLSLRAGSQAIPTHGIPFRVVLEEGLASPPPASSGTSSPRKNLLFQESASPHARSLVETDTFDDRDLLEMYADHTTLTLSSRSPLGTQSRNVSRDSRPQSHSLTVAPIPETYSPHKAIPSVRLNTGQSKPIALYERVRVDATSMSPAMRTRLLSRGRT